MHVLPIETKGSKLIEDYRQKKADALQFFDYNPFDGDSYKERLKELHVRKYKRKALADILYDLNLGWRAPEKTLKNVKLLNDEKSVVVVGGQQAGLLTGPIYTVHKIVSILKLAKEQEQKLGVPVIPVFWIAGEDHDFAEINHVQLPIPPQMKKLKIMQRQLKKQPVSTMELDKDAATSWVKTIFSQLDETSHSKQLLDNLISIVEESNTYVDFFAKTIFSIFREEGLVLVDSNNSNIRKIESNYFINLMEKREKIAYGVIEMLNKTSKQDYHIALDAEPNDGHLFYHLDGERILLTVNKNGEWVGKNNECTFLTEELKEIAKAQPESLSNNVVTRPIMQDLLLPVLAFIGGPGEVAYWSVLKPSFHALEIKMPPVVPRLSYTIMDQKSKKYLNQIALEEEEVVRNGVLLEKGMWLKRRMNPPIEALADHLKFSIERAHRPLKELANELQSDLGSIADKNLVLLLREVEYLEQRLMYEIESKNELTLAKFDWLESYLHPEGGLQERCWNVFYWINIFGDKWIGEMLQLDVDWNQPHYMIYL